MIAALAQYTREEVLVRTRAIVFGTEALISVAVAIATALYGPSWRFAHVRPAELSLAMLTYAAIAFGFCISGMALALTFPNQTFVTWLVEGYPGKKGNVYLDLLFVFSWTAVSHWTLVLLAFFLLALGPERQFLLASSDGWSWRVFVGALCGAASYSFIQFLLTVITLSQVGRLYVRKIERELQRRDLGAAPER
jgi:hypothetical protein